MNQSTSNNTTVPDYDFLDLSKDYIGSQNGSSDEDLDYLYKNYQDIIEFTEDYIFVSSRFENRPIGFRKKSIPFLDVFGCWWPYLRLTWSPKTSKWFMIISEWWQSDGHCLYIYFYYWSMRKSSSYNSNRTRSTRLW